VLQRAQVKTTERVQVGLARVRVLVQMQTRLRVPCCKGQPRRREQLHPSKQTLKRRQNQQWQQPSAI